MRTVKKIFIDDVIGLVKNFFALVIVVGICFLPALYAWFNIYSNWDPYGNTGALKFAAVSLDKGFTDENGEYHNQGDTIIENLHENTAVDWQFVDSADEATEGVYSGEYYAAVVVDENFTYNMYNVLTEEVDRPTLHFYENQKKNPVATKISDTVVQSLQNNINVAFTEVVVSKVFTSAANISEDIQEEGSLDKAISELKTLSADLTNYQNALNQIIASDAQLQNSLKLAKQDASNLESQAYTSASAVKNSSNVTQEVNTTINSYTKDVNETVNTIQTKINEMNSNIDVAKASNDAATIATNLKNAMVSAAQVEALVYSLPGDIGQENIDNAKNDLLTGLNSVVNLMQLLQAFPGNTVDFSTEIASVNNAIEMINNADTSVEGYEARLKGVNSLIDSVNQIDVNKIASAGSENLTNAINNTEAKIKGIQNTVNDELTPKVTTGLSNLSKLYVSTILKIFFAPVPYVSKVSAYFVSISFALRFGSAIAGFLPSKNLC